MTTPQLLVIAISIPLAAVLSAMLYAALYWWAKDRDVSRGLVLVSIMAGFGLGMVLLGMGQGLYVSMAAQGASVLALSALSAVLYLLPSLIVVAALYTMHQIEGYLSGALYGGAAALGVTVAGNWFYFVPVILSVPLEMSHVFGYVLGYGVGFPITLNLVQIVAGATVGFGFGMARWAASAGRRVLWIAAALALGLMQMTGYLSMVTAIFSIPERVLAAIIFALSGLGAILAATRSTQLGEALIENQSAKRRVEKLVQGVVPLGMALAEEKDFNRLLDRILGEAQTFANADGATLYLRTAEDQMDYVIVRNNSLNIRLGGSGEPDPEFTPLPLKPANEAEKKPVVAATVLSKSPVNIADIYKASEFDFSGPRDFDAKNSYRTESILCVPLKNAAGEAIGAMQLINAKDALTGRPIPFNDETQQIVESVSSLAASALVSYIRAEKLRQQVGEFKINIKTEDRDAQVDEIAGSEFFSALQGQVAGIRARKKQSEAKQVSG